MGKNRLDMEYENDFKFVLKVLDSCELYGQIKGADNLYHNFLKKWNIKSDPEKYYKVNSQWILKRELVEEKVVFYKLK